VGFKFSISINHNHYPLTVSHDAPPREVLAIKSKDLNPRVSEFSHNSSPTKKEKIEEEGKERQRPRVRSCSLA